MKKNIGTADRLIRLAAVMTIAALYFKGLVSGKMVVPAIIVIAILLITATIGTCPLYLLFRISTKDKTK